MKTKIILVFMLITFFGCTHLSTLTDIKAKYGPPAKIEETQNATIYFYYFYKGKVSGATGSIISAEVSQGWIVVEFIADRSGKVIDTRKYWKQPESPPK